MRELMSVCGGFGIGFFIYGIFTWSPNMLVVSGILLLVWGIDHRRAVKEQEVIDRIRHTGK
jgi:hypothetical protein